MNSFTLRTSQRSGSSTWTKQVRGSRELVLNHPAGLDRDLGIGAIIPKCDYQVLGSFDARPAQDLFVGGIAMDLG